MPAGGHSWTVIPPDDLPIFAYRWWRGRVSGLVELASAGGEREVLALRSGAWVVGRDRRLNGQCAASLESWSGKSPLYFHLDVDTSSVPPGSGCHRFQLGDWARTSLETSLKGVTRRAWKRTLESALLTLRAPYLCQLPQRVEFDELLITELARACSVEALLRRLPCSREQLLTTLYFLYRVGELIVDDHSRELAEAVQILGVSSHSSAALKDLYRRRVRSLHPDSQVAADQGYRRKLERELARVNRAYALLRAMQ